MSTKTKRFHNPPEFPNEAFVQERVERHFAGYQIEEKDFVDLVCVHPETGERWVIEAKGHSSDPGLDFRTCLGQIIVAMDRDDSRYAIALPLTQKYLVQCQKVSSRVRQALGLCWLFVDQQGDVLVVEPGASLPQSLGDNRF